MISRKGGSGENRWGQPAGRSKIAFREVAACKRPGTNSSAKKISIVGGEKVREKTRGKGT